MVNTNQVLQLNIINQNYEGLGVAKPDDLVVFVKGAITGEVVKAKVTKVTKTYCLATLQEVIKPSNARIKPLCPYFGKCGGCDLLHMEYEAGLKHKLASFNETLKRIGHIDYKANNIIGMEDPYRYRDKIQMPASKNIKGKLAFGYFQKDSHELISIDDCLVQSTNVTSIINFVKNVCNELGISSYDEASRSGAIRHILIRENYKNELMIVIVTNEEDMAKEKILVEKILYKYPNVTSIIKNINKTANNVILGDKSVCLFGKDEIVDRLLGIDFRISHRSFFQINRVQTEKLYSKVLDYLGDNASELNVIDAYCGVGTISLCLAKKAKYVYGIEVVKEAIDDAKYNAKLNGVSNVEFHVGKVEDKIKEFIDKDIDCIVIDPPRKGVEENVLNAIMESEIKKVIYVSCNPATLARDLSILKEAYDIENMVLVDMFCHTNAVEVLTKLIRK